MEAFIFILSMPSFQSYYMRAIPKARIYWKKNLFITGTKKFDDEKVDTIKNDKTIKKIYEFKVHVLTPVNWYPYYAWADHD